MNILHQYSYIDKIIRLTGIMPVIFMMYWLYGDGGGEGGEGGGERSKEYCKSYSSRSPKEILGEKHWKFMESITCGHCGS